MSPLSTVLIMMQLVALLVQIVLVTAGKNTAAKFVLGINVGICISVITASVLHHLGA